ncbi:MULTISPECIES: pilus assembly protein PilM [Clostridium]|uniref:pilus assembly protein PilM n=1 Tax=Clostridium TaxID=1485 RepID=UPI000822CAD4|nr:pilus assembly protein PilM [Clostridium saudiense]MDU7455858.1 pilus assembly protein PilM [Clostridium saudiense]SCK01097.1 type IV pilus assembly protein PilM [uncultured Clostridium sp.]
MAITSNKKLSIQITDTSINILIGNKNKIYETHTIELENGDCKDGNVRDKDSIVKLLNDYLYVNGRDVKNVSFVLRGSDIITRYIEVPILKNDALIEAVNFEFKQFIPDIDDYYMNYEIVEKINTKEKKAYKILLVAATKEKINPIIEIAEEIGKELEVIDILSNSLARVLKSSDHIASEESTGIFYFGADSSTLGIIEGNVLKFERNLPFGIKNIFNEVYEEAAVTALDSKQVTNVFENNEQLMMNFENLLASVNNTVRYYNSEKNNKPVTNFIIICADMIMTNMEKYLEKYFELPCILVKDPSDLGLKLKFKDNFPKYISSYGLLLRGNDNKLLNLSPKTIKKEKDKANIDKVLVRVPILILIAVIAIGIPFLVMNKIITKEIANIEADIARYNEIVVKNQQLQSEINKMEYFINRIKDIDNSTSNTSEIISKLNTYVPKEITFEGFSFTDSGLINISGKSSTYSAIPEFLANLEMSEEFCNAKISYINPIEETIEVSSLDEENGSISTRGTFMPIALTGSVNIWDEIIELASDDANDKTNVTQDNSDKTNNGSEGTNSEINKNTIIKYSFSITIEGVSKDGSKAKATE